MVAHSPGDRGFSGVMQTLVNLAYAGRSEFGERARVAFTEALQERYPRVPDLRDRKNDERRFQLRVNADTKDGAVPYAALIPPDQDLSGGYGGMSFVMFPADDSGAPALIAMVVGTNGLAPDEAVLGRPGHGRKCASIAAWLNDRRPGGAWAKRDPVRIDLDLPRLLAQRLGRGRAPSRSMAAWSTRPSSRPTNGPRQAMRSSWRRSRPL